MNKKTVWWLILIFYSFGLIGVYLTVDNLIKATIAVKTFLTLLIFTIYYWSVALIMKIGERKRKGEEDE